MTVWERMGTNQMRTSRGHLSKHGRGREAGPHDACVTETVRQAQGGKRGRAPMCPSQEEAGSSSPDKGRPMPLVGVHICLSRFGSKLETGAKVTDIGSYWSDPCCLGPIPTGVVGLPEWLLAIGGQRPVYLDAPTIVTLYMPFPNS